MAAPRTRMALALLAALVLGAGAWRATRSPDAGGGAPGATAQAPWSTAAGQPAPRGSADPFMTPPSAGQQEGPLADPLLRPGLRYAMDELLNAALQAGDTRDPAELKRRLRALVDQHFGAEVRERALALALRYVDYRSALARIEPPADLSDAKAVRDAMQARDQVRQPFFDRGEYDALFADEAALDRLTLARLGIDADRNLTPEQRTQALRAAEEALPPSMRAQREAATAQLGVAQQTAALDARNADDATRYAERSARYGEAAAQALAARDTEERQWQQRLDQYQQARAANGDGPALQQLRQQLFSPEERLRVDAALALRGAAGGTRRGGG